MTKQHFSFKEVFMFGWDKTKQHAWFVFLTFIIAFIVTSSVQFIPVVNALVALMAGLSLVSISILIAKDQHFTFHDLYAPLLSAKRVLKFIAATIIYAVAVSIGFILLIIPGVYIATRFKFFPYVVIENEDLSMADLIKKTYKLSHNHFWVIFAFLVMATILNFIGALLLMVGLIVTVPVTLFASAYMYNRLKEHTV